MHSLINCNWCVSLDIAQMLASNITVYIFFMKFGFFTHVYKFMGLKQRIDVNNDNDSDSLKQTTNNKYDIFHRQVKT